MKLLSIRGDLLLHGALIAPVQADSFNLSAWESTTGGSIISHRIWYGDGKFSLLRACTRWIVLILEPGQAYTGAGVPASVKQAFNITCEPTSPSPPSGPGFLYVTLTRSALGNRADLIYVSVDETTSAPDTPPLPDPTFLVINTAPEASDPLFFAHSAVNLSSTDVYIWIGYEGFLLAMARGNLLQSGTGGFYMVPTELNGTYTVRYIAEGATAETLGGRKVMLTSRQSR